MQLIALPEAENDNCTELGLSAMAGEPAINVVDMRSTLHGPARHAERPYEFPSYPLCRGITLSYHGFGAKDCKGRGDFTVWDVLAVAALTSMQKVTTELYK